MRLFILVTLIISSGQVLSQDQSKLSRIDIGITAGFRLSGIQLDFDQPNASSFDYNRKSGYQIGIPFTYSFKKHLYLLSGVLFINDNTNAISDATAMQSDLNFKWVGIPISLRYDILRNQNYKLFIGGGFGFNRLLSASNRLTISQNSTTTTNEFNVYETISPWNVSGSIQFGSDFKLGHSFPLSIVISFDKTLSNMLQKVDSGNNPDFDFLTIQGDMRLHSFSISLSYFFQ